MICRRGVAGLAAGFTLAAALTACTSSSQGSNPPPAPATSATAPSTPSSQPPDSAPPDTAPADTAPPQTQAPATGSGGGSADFDGSYTGYVYPPGYRPDQGIQLTFTVSDGQVHDWLGYQVGTCTSVTEEDYIQGPVTIHSGVWSADVKTDVPNSGGEYTNTYVQGVFDGTQASGTVDYTAVGPCVEAQQRWVAVRSGG